MKNTEWSNFLDVSLLLLKEGERGVNKIVVEERFSLRSTMPAA